MRRRLALVCLLALGPPAPAAAEGASLFATAAAGGGSLAVPRSGSLFSGAAAGSLFAPWPERGGAVGGLDPFRPMPGPGGAVGQLRDLVASVEAGPAGYDAVQHGARLRPARAPTQLTLADIEAWIAATPGQPHAIGRYQIIPSTLRGLARDLGLPPDTRFSPAVQDRMANRLLDQAGLADFLAGRLGRQAFMNNLARVWAGLPNSSGQSHYHGHAGNRAGMTWASYEQAMQAIFPASRL